MKKILHVVAAFQYGGTEAFIVNNFKHIDNTKYDFDLYIASSKGYRGNSDDYISEVRKIGMDVYYGENFESKIKFISNLYKFLVESNYDIVHSHCNLMNSWVLIAAFLAKKKVRISHSHALNVSKHRDSVLKQKIYYNFLRKLILLMATDKLSCSIEAGEYLYGTDYFQKHGIMINNGIDCDKFMNPSQAELTNLKSQYNINEDDFIMGNITRFSKNKNASFTVDVFNEILKKRPNSILLLGGPDGGELSNVEKKVKKLGIEEKVIFLGMVNDVSLFIALMDAYILPSYTEGLPFVALESQASRTPCFLSDTITEEVDIGLNIIHFIDLNKGAKYWADYILTHYQNNIPEKVVVKDIFKKAGFDIETSVKLLESVYE